MLLCLWGLDVLNPCVGCRIPDVISWDWVASDASPHMLS